MFWFCKTEMRMTSSGSWSTSICSSRSVLLSRTMRLAISEMARRLRSCSVRGSDALRTSRIRSASSRAFWTVPHQFFNDVVCFTDTCCINQLEGTPLMLTYSSITSRVVPAMSVTMAFSSRRRLLSRLDFPTFGRPIIAVAMPSRRIFPRRAVRRRFSKRAWNWRVFSRTSSVVASSTSSYSGSRC